MAAQSPQLRTVDIRADASAAALVPRELAERFGVLPLFVNRDCLTVATPDPDNLLVLDEIGRHARMRIAAVRAGELEVLTGIQQAYGQQEAMHYAPGEAEEAPSARAEAVAELVETRPAIRTIDEIIRSAVRERASDIHLEAQESCVYVRFRVDGIMHDFMTLPTDMHPALISRLKIMSKLNISERRLPQDGRFGVTLGTSEYDVRVSSIPTTTGEKIVLRFLPKTDQVLQLEQIGLAPGPLEILKTEINRSYGMMLVTGPTGSGKTTTLYAVLSRIDCVSKNVVTVEDPVEYEFPRVSQIQVHPKIGLTFASGLRHVLRQDPDVLMIGEIRDTETLHMAIRCALTGHMVFSTVHCNDAAATPARLIDMDAEPFLLASCLTAVVAQRLVRCICRNCKEQYTPSASVYHSLGLEPEMGPVYRGVGCNQCRGTGYWGRRAVFEVMAVTDEVRDAILRGVPAAGIRDLIRRASVPSLRADGIWKAQTGVTTLEEVLRVTQLE